MLSMMPWPLLAGHDGRARSGALLVALAIAVVGCQEKAPSVDSPSAPSPKVGPSVASAAAPSASSTSSAVTTEVGAVLDSAAMVATYETNRGCMDRVYVGARLRFSARVARVEPNPFDSEKIHLNLATGPEQAPRLFLTCAMPKTQQATMEAAMKDNTKLWFAGENMGFFRSHWKKDAPFGGHVQFADCKPTQPSAQIEPLKCGPAEVVTMPALLASYKPGPSKYEGKDVRLELFKGTKQNTAKLGSRTFFLHWLGSAAGKEDVVCRFSNGAELDIGDLEPNTKVTVSARSGGPTAAKGALDLTDCAVVARPDVP